MSIKHVDALLAACYEGEGRALFDRCKFITHAWNFSIQTTCILYRVCAEEPATPTDNTFSRILLFSVWVLWGENVKTSVI